MSAPLARPAAFSGRSISKVRARDQHLGQTRGAAGDQEERPRRPAGSSSTNSRSRAPEASVRSSGTGWRSRWISTAGQRLDARLEVAILGEMSVRSSRRAQRIVPRAPWRRPPCPRGDLVARSREVPAGRRAIRASRGAATPIDRGESRLAAVRVAVDDADHSRSRNACRRAITGTRAAHNPQRAANSSRRSALAASERSSCRRCRYSGVTSPVMY